MDKVSQKGDRSFGVASVVLGILSIVFSITMVPSLVLGVLALIFALVQKKKEKNNWYLWGLVLAILGIALSILILVFFVSLISNIQETISSCTANPNLPGCEQILKAVQSQQYAAQ